MCKAARNICTISLEKCLVQEAHVLKDHIADSRFYLDNYTTDVLFQRLRQDNAYPISTPLLSLLQSIPCG